MGVNMTDVVHDEETWRRRGPPAHARGIPRLYRRQTLTPTLQAPWFKALIREERR